MLIARRFTELLRHFVSADPCIETLGSNQYHQRETLGRLFGGTS
jgi:hypothetical protein